MKRIINPIIILGVALTSLIIPNTSLAQTTEPNDVYGVGYSTKNEITTYTLNNIGDDISIRTLCQIQDDTNCDTAVVYSVYSNSNLRVYAGGGTSIFGEQSFGELSAVAGAVYNIGAKGIYGIADGTYIDENLTLFLGIGAEL